MRPWTYKCLAEELGVKLHQIDNYFRRNQEIRDLHNNTVTQWKSDGFVVCRKCCEIRELGVEFKGKSRHCEICKEEAREEFNRKNREKSKAKREKLLEKKKDLEDAISELDRAMKSSYRQVQVTEAPIDESEEDKFLRLNTKLKESDDPLTDDELDELIPLMDKYFVVNGKVHNKKTP